MATVRAAGPLLGIALAIALFVQTRGFDRFARSGQLGPGFWPRVVLVGLAVACAAKLVESWRTTRAGARSGAEAGELGEISRARLATGITLLVLYVALTPWIGFPLATGAFIGAFMRLSGARSGLTLAASAIIGTVTLLYGVVKLVYLPLPKGAGPFEALTIALLRGLGIF